MMILMETNPFWWAQPLATVCGAVLVLYGVHRTLRGNADRLREQQIRDRERDKEKRLQEYYGNFAAAAFDSIMTYVQVWIARNTLTRLKSPPVPLPDDSSEVLQAKTKIAESESRREEVQSAMSGAIARIRLMDSNAERVERLVTLRGSVIGLESKPRAENLQAVVDRITDIEAFIAGVAAELEAEYRKATEFARQGAHPPIVIRNTTGAERFVIPESFLQDIGKHALASRSTNNS